MRTLGWPACALRCFTNQYPDLIFFVAIETQGRFYGCPGQRSWKPRTKVCGEMTINVTGSSKREVLHHLGADFSAAAGSGFSLAP